MNTIYDNTFTIGQTSAINFEAGPGITVTEPTAGTVRIGNDETVLWSGTPVKLSSETVLTEPMTNFTRIDFYFAGFTTTGTQNDKVDNITPTKKVAFIHGAGDANVWYQWAHLSASNDYSKIIFDKGKSINFGSVTTTTWSNPSISTGIPDTFNCYKIVGINRIGGNV